MNTDFLLWVRPFDNDFYEWQNENRCRITSWATKKLVFMLTNTLYHFLHAILCPDWAHKPAETIIDCSLLPFSPRAVFLGYLTWRHHHSPICDITQTRGVVILTSYSLIVLACTNWCKGSLHWCITTVDINFPLPSIHSITQNYVVFTVRWYPAKRALSAMRMQYHVVIDWLVTEPDCIPYNLIESYLF